MKIDSSQAHAEIQRTLDGWRRLVDAALDERLPGETISPQMIHKAMRFTVLAPGKRIRPIMSLCVARFQNAPAEQVLDAACAIEFMHSASLILDDLPAMDNAACRRGRPSAHVAFGESTAILAATALMASSFDLMAKNAGACLDTRGAMLVQRQFAHAVGAGGLIGGQFADLGLAGQLASLEELEEIYGGKAGALFLAALTIPARLLRMPESQVEILERYGAAVGLAFQITDDLHDASQQEEDRGKTTFSTLLGREGAVRKVSALIDGARRALGELKGDTDLFEVLAEMVRERAN